MKQALLIIVAGLALVANAYAEVTPGENGSGWTTGRHGKSTTQTMTQANVAGDLEDFDDIPEGTTVSATYTFAHPQAYLVGVEFRSTNCADCDIAITEGAAAVGRVIFSADGTTTDPCDVASAIIPDGAPTTYSQYVNCQLAQLVTSTSGSVTVWITNNDSEGGDDEDVVVWLKWESK